MHEEDVFFAAESLMRQWKLEEATALLERRLSEPFPPARIHHDLSVLYSQQGLFQPALESIEAAMAHDPENRAVWHHYLALQKNNPEQPEDAAWKSMHLQFGDTLRARFDARHLAVSRARDPDGRLRIGYLGPDTHNAAERFVGPVLERFDRKAFEVVAYWNHARSLANERRYPDVLHRTIAGSSTEEIVGMILRDRIDVLVDVAGHGAGNALPALAQRPAPIQMTWLDYLATTGLEPVDYRISDGIADPEGAEARHVEELLRLPVPQWCYSPPIDVPLQVRARSNEVVFGAISVPLKLSAPLLDLWVRLLACVPAARLRFLGIPEGRARERIVAAFRKGGIDPARLDIRGRLPLREFFAELATIDVVLDTYPFSGATATLDALWQGTPVASIAGRLSHGRSGASILASLGKAQWVAANEEEYIAIASRLARDCGNGAFDRGKLREELKASALCDAARFVGALESAYRGAWKEWLRRTGSLESAGLHANSRADVLLAGESGGASRCRDLVDTLPAHKVTGQVFWAEFRATHADVPEAPALALRDVADIMSLDAEPLPGGDALLHGRREWLAITTLRHAGAAGAAVLPATAISECDALAAFGADSVPHGSLVAAGRGRAAGISAHVAGDAIHAQLWLPTRMNECAALSGQVLLVRRSIVEAHRFPNSGFASDPDFARAVAAYTIGLHRDGVRLGICASLVVPSLAVADPAERFRNERALAREMRLDGVPQTEVAASALQAVVPRSAWPAFVRRAGRFCDWYCSVSRRTAL